MHNSLKIYFYKPPASIQINLKTLSSICGSTPTIYLILTHWWAPGETQELMTTRMYSSLFRGGGRGESNLSNFYTEPMFIKNDSSFGTTRCWAKSSCIQLFRERLWEKSAATIPKGNMGYDQYTVPDDCSCRSYFYFFPLALANTFPWPFVPILSNFFEKKKTQNHPQCLSGLSRALLPTTFLEIAVDITNAQLQSQLMQLLKNA